MSVDAVLYCVSPPVPQDVGPLGTSIFTIAPPHQKLLTTLCIAWTLHHAQRMVSVAVGRGGGVKGRGGVVMGRGGGVKGRGEGGG